MLFITTTLKFKVVLTRYLSSQKKIITLLLSVAIFQVAGSCGQIIAANELSSLGSKSYKIRIY